ncbi:MAG: fluoride efflux transporter CrcB [Candidatus Aquicultor sp.]|nr:fluoride efflux transporter CrcB [Candidatus Aquicultor sp.]
MGGFFGAIARYLVGGWVMNSGRFTFPLGTLVVNVTGSFILGLFFALAIERFPTGGFWRPFFAIGFLGAYTTFSTFSLETMNLVESGSFFLAAANILASVVFSLAGVYLGIVIGRSI